MMEQINGYDLAVVEDDEVGFYRAEVRMPSGGLVSVSSPFPDPAAAMESARRTARVLTPIERHCVGCD